MGVLMRWMQEEPVQPSHPWQARMGVGVIMLALAFIGIVVTDIRPQGGWDYWKWVVPIYAVLALWLSWYVKRKKQTIRPITLWHELLHWLGVIGCVLLVSHLVELGTISRFIAGLFQLILLSLALFLAGIYIESILIVVGVMLGLFALVTALLIQYLYALLIPILVGGILLLALSVWMSHKRFTAGS